MPRRSSAGSAALLGEVDDLAFGDAANVIQMETAFAFSFFGIDAGTYEREHDQTNREQWLPHPERGPTSNRRAVLSTSTSLARLRGVEFGIGKGHRFPTKDYFTESRAARATLDGKAMHWITQHADSGHGDFDGVVGDERADAGGRSGGDQVTGIAGS